MDLKNKKTLFLLCFLAIISIVGFRCSFMIGSHRCYFSLASLLFPILGSFLTVGISFACVSSFFIFKWLCGFSALTFGIPTACAAMNWSAYSCKNNSLKNELKKIFISILLPTLCILFFVLHPVGGVAFLYSFYWFIPIGIYFFQRFLYRSFFLTALASTFIAHAVGSVIWLYTVPMVPEKWIALIPVVAYERFLFAAIGASAYVVVARVMKSSWVRKVAPVFRLNR